MSRIVLITGASSGYGKATAKAFKDNGDTVIMTARNLEKLEQAKLRDEFRAIFRRNFGLQLENTTFVAFFN